MTPNRLHVSTLWLPVLELFRRSIVPVVIGCIVATPFVVLPGFAFFVVLPTLVYHAIRYKTVTFQATPDELVIHSGWLSRRERRIPWQRVQETEMQQGLLRRPFGLTRLKLKTAGSDDEEASLDVITVAQAEAIQSAANGLPSELGEAAESGGVTVSEPADYRCELTTRQLVGGGLTSNVVASVFAMIGAVVYFQLFFGQRVDWLSEDQYRRLTRPPAGPIQKLDEASEEFREMLPSLGPLDPVIDFFFSETLFKSVGLALLGLTASVAGFVIRYHGFTLQRRGDRLTVASGLLTRNQNQLDRRRIQSLKLDEGLLRRLFGLASVQVDSAGDRQKVDENKNREVLVPIAPKPLADDVASQAIPGLRTLTPDWNRVSPLAIGRGTRKGSLVLIAAMIQAAVWSSWLAISLSPGFLVVYGLNRKWYRHTGYWIGEQHLMFRKGWLNRSTLCLPITNIQNVRLSQTPFDRRLRLATLSIDTAGQSNTGGGPVIKHLPVREARQIQKKLAECIAATPFSW